MRILVVESDRPVAAFLRKALQAESYAVDIVSTGEEAVGMAERVDFDLIILALLLPGLDGFQTLEHLCMQKRHPRVLILSRLTGVQDRVRCLDSGADDYMTKPFSIRELLARVRALLRRPAPSEGLILTVADLKLDRVAHTVWRGNQQIELSPREFVLLEYLMSNADKPLSRSVIAEHVWDPSLGTGSNVVDVYISYLRKKIDYGLGRSLIRTVRKVGYKIGDPDKARPEPRGKGCISWDA